MVVAIIFAHVWGVMQMILLGSVARTIRVRTALAAIAVGLYACAPLTTVLEVSWTRLAAPLMGVATVQLVRTAAYTVDPFLEEVIKLLPLAALLMIPAIRRQWSVTDYVLIGAAAGAGFGLAEDLYRFGASPDRAHPIATGWAVALSRTYALIPSFGGALFSWLPTAVAGAGDGSRVNAHLVWSAIGGLAVGLLLIRRTTAARLAAVGLFLCIGLDHAAGNTTHLSNTWLTTLATPLGVLARWRGLMPIAALAGAWWLDRHRPRLAPAFTWVPWPTPSLSALRSALRQPAVIIWLVLMTPPVLWFVVGGWPQTARLQAVMMAPVVSKALFPVSVLVQAWLVWQTITGLRAWPQVRRLSIGDEAAVAGMRLACSIGAAGLGTFSLMRLVGGLPAGSSLLSGLHAADAANSVTPTDGSMVAATAVAAVPPESAIPPNTANAPASPPRTEAASRAPAPPKPKASSPPPPSQPPPPQQPKPSADEAVAAARDRARQARDAADAAEIAAADDFDDPWGEKSPKKAAADAARREARQADADQAAAEEEYLRKKAAELEAAKAAEAQAAADLAAANQKAAAAQRAADPEGAAADDAAARHAAAQQRADQAFYDTSAGNDQAYRAALEAARVAKEHADAARAIADAAQAARAAHVTPIGWTPDKP